MQERPAVKLQMPQYAPVPELVYGSASKAAAEKRASSNLAGSTKITERGLEHEQEDEEKVEENG